MTQVWTNDDGLIVKFGNRQSDLSAGGKPAQAGNELVAIYEFNLADLTDAPAAIGSFNNLGLGKGDIIHSATVDVLTGATSGGAATLDIGVGDADGTGGDPDGIDADIALTAIDTKGERVQCDGATIGTELSENEFITASYETAAFTAGRVRLTVHYSPTLNREAQ